MTPIRAFIVAVAVVIAGLCAPLIGGLHPSTRGMPYRAPTAEHVLGTDALGNDVLAQLLVHAPSTFAVPAVAALILAAAGSALVSRVVSS